MTIFYSRQSGNWEDGANWHVDTIAPSTGGHTGTAMTSPGVAGTDYPGAGDQAIISAGHTITVTTDMSALATAVTISCDTTTAPNNGTLKFSETVNTGLKMATGSPFAGSLTIQAGTRTAPIQRGVTCYITTAGNISPGSGGTITMDVWGQHREHSSSHVYCDTFASSASRGNTTITVNRDIVPTLQADDWLWLCENDQTGTNTVAAELVQIDSYDSGTGVVTLKTPLKFAYTTTHGLVYRAKEKHVNAYLDAAHTSGSDYVLDEDLYPSGTAGGSFLVQQCNLSPKSQAIFPAVSSYNSGTKTLTAGSSSSNTYSPGSHVLMDDFNVIVEVTATGRAMGSTGLGNTGKFRFNYCRLEKWRGIIQSGNNIVLYNSNAFGCLSVNNDTVTGAKILAYGFGMGHKSTSDNGDRNVIVGANGHSMTRCLIGRSSNGSGSILNGVRNGQFKDCSFMSASSLIIGCSENTFDNCSIGNITNISSTGIGSGTTGNIFRDCHIYGFSGTGTPAIDYPGSEVNLLENCVFGENKKGVALPNAISIHIRQQPVLHLMHGITFAGSEPLPSWSIVDNQNEGTSLIRIAKRGGVTNQFGNYTPGGRAEDDPSGYRSSAPSIKFTHSSANHPVWFDVPMFLNAGSKTINVWTNPSTGSWTDPPQIFLMEEQYADQLCKYLQDLKYIDRAIQSTLTTSTYSQLTLNTTIAADGIYILRLWARNASGTLNWDDITVS